MSLSFVYQCYKQPLACRHAIESIRKFYKDAPIFLFNDGGDPVHETIAESFNNVRYEYCERASELDCGNYSKGTIKAKQYFQRILKAIQTMNTKYVLIMEDDVHIYKEIDIASLNADLNGGHPTTWSQNITDYCQWWKNNSKLIHAGAGGSIMRSEFFKNVLSDPMIDKHLDVFFNTLRPGIAGTDLLLSFITYVYEGKIELYPGYCEKHWPDYKIRSMNGSIDVLHEFKDYYVY
jgi:hypothetical protein